MAIICPMISQGTSIIQCMPNCAWFDTNTNKCVIKNIRSADSLDDIARSLKKIEVK